MPIIVMMLCALALIGISVYQDKGKPTPKEYALVCKAKGGVVLRGFTDEGEDGIGCFNVKELEIK